MKQKRSEQYDYEIASGDFSAYSAEDLAKARKYLENKPPAGEEIALSDVKAVKKTDFEANNLAHDQRMRANPWFKLSHLADK